MNNSHTIAKLAGVCIIISLFLFCCCCCASFDSHPYCVSGYLQKERMPWKMKRRKKNTLVAYKMWILLHCLYVHTYMIIIYNQYTCMVIYAFVCRSVNMAKNGVFFHREGSAFSLFFHLHFDRHHFSSIKEQKGWMTRLYLCFTNGPCVSHNAIKSYIFQLIDISFELFYYVWHFYFFRGILWSFEKFHVIFCKWIRFFAFHSISNEANRIEVFYRWIEWKCMYVENTKSSWNAMIHINPLYSTRCLYRQVTNR